MASSKMSLKLLVDKKEQRVLFAEAGKDFVDFLFSLLALPVATVIRLLHNKNIEGGMGKLYKSVSDLNDDYIQSDKQKDVLLQPQFTLPFFSPQLSLLSTETFSSAPNSSATFYSRYVLKPSKGGGFVKGLVTYMVMDDLVVTPMSAISNITSLNKYNIKDLGALEEKIVHIGMNEGLELLKHSLYSKTVLTDVFLGEVVDGNLKKV